MFQRSVVFAWVCLLASLYSAAEEIQKVSISFTTPAYTGMPVWVLVNSPSPDKVRYPYSTVAWGIGPNRLEVRQDGKTVEPKQYPIGATSQAGILGGSIAPPTSPQGRLPLHILYPLVPGTYEVRYTRFRYQRANGQLETYTTEQSDWTKLTIEPYDENVRRDWFKQRLSNLPSDDGMLIGDAIPELLARPDRDVLEMLVQVLCKRSGIASAFARDTVIMFPEQEISSALVRGVRQYGPSEDSAFLLSWRRKSLYDHTRQIIDSVLPYLNSNDDSKVAGAIKTLQFMRATEMGFPLDAGQRRRMDDAVVGASGAILQRKSEVASSNLAQYVGGAKPKEARKILWEMVRQRAAYEQSLICIAWLADPRDLPSLVTELKRDDPLDADGRQRSSVLYQLPRQYGSQAYPYIADVFANSSARFVRESAEAELMPPGPVTFRAFQAILEHGDATAQKRIRGFVRSHFSAMASATDKEVLAFVRSKAR